MWTTAHALISSQNRLHDFAASAASTPVNFSEAMVLFITQRSFFDFLIAGDVSPTKLGKNNVNPPCDSPLSKLPKDESL